MGKGKKKGNAPKKSYKAVDDKILAEADKNATEKKKNSPNTSLEVPTNRSKEETVKDENVNDLKTGSHSSEITPKVEVAKETNTEELPVNDTKKESKNESNVQTEVTKTSGNEKLPKTNMKNYSSATKSNSGKASKNINVNITVNINTNSHPAQNVGRGRGRGIKRQDAEGPNQGNFNRGSREQQGTDKNLTKQSENSKKSIGTEANTKIVEQELDNLRLNEEANENTVENWEEQTGESIRPNEKKTEDQIGLGANDSDWNTEPKITNSSFNVDAPEFDPTKPAEGSTSSGNWGTQDTNAETSVPCHKNSTTSWETDKNVTPSNQKHERIQKQGRDMFDRKVKDDRELSDFESEFRKNPNFKFEKVKEIEGDLFAMPKDYSLGHCVAEDLRMGSGIAVNFKRDFKDIDQLLNQRTKQGGLAMLEDDKNKRYIYYLVTKKVSNGKPTYDTLWSSVKKMRDHIMENKVAKLAIPRIGCGLDRLEWSRVKSMIEYLFRNVQVEITVCNFQQSEDSIPQKSKNSCRVVNYEKSVLQIEEWTTILYFSTEDGHVSDIMKDMDKKFNFLSKFKYEQKRLGSVVRFDSNYPKNYILYGCIVKKTQKDLFDFTALAKCVAQINKNNNKDQYEYVAFQLTEDANDDLINEKIVTILRNYLRNVQVYVCSNDSKTCNLEE